MKGSKKKGRFQNMDWNQIWNTITAWSMDFGKRLLIAILVLIVGRLVIKWVIKLMTKSKFAEKNDKTVTTVLSHFVSAALYVLLVVIIIGILGVPTASVITVIASAGVAIGLALQGALSNIAGGIMILVLRPFRVGDYVELADYTLGMPLPRHSEIITSDGVFERVLEIRRLNDGIDDKREEMVREYIEEVSKEEPNLLRGLDDFDRWKRASDMRNPNKSQSSFLRKNLIRNFEERSNGESALAFFVDSIKDNTLYLLDEPENSLSAENQLQLKYFIEDCVRNHGCQFIISTHSPFLLSIAHATIYDIDTTPPEQKKWTELDSVRAYYDFFKENEWKFEN
jgi:hypothetical protein